jgi:hypothetical protein
MVLVLTESPFYLQPGRPRDAPQGVAGQAPGWYSRLVDIIYRGNPSTSSVTYRESPLSRWRELVESIDRPLASTSVEDNDHSLDRI